MSVTGQLDRQVVVHSHDTSQEFNPDVYQFRRGLCVENL